MLIIDLGNSTLSFGIFYEGNWKTGWKIPTSIVEDKALLARTLTDIFLEERIESDMLEKVIVSSVVPTANEIIREIFENAQSTKVFKLLAPEDFVDIPVIPNRPYEIGTDLLANANAAAVFYQKNKAKPVIVLDFGTALTFTVIDENSLMKGVAISPGLNTAMSTLSNSTAQLPEIPLDRPKSVFGTDTTTAIQIGIVEGYIGLVNHLVLKMNENFQEKPILIYTGGLSKLMFQHHFFKDQEVIKDENLTLKGIKVIYDALNN